MPNARRNPIACAAGLASLDLLQKKTCIGQIQAISRANENFLVNRLLKDRSNLILNPRTTGTVLAFELNSSEHDYISRIGNGIRQASMQQGIYLRPLGNTIYIMPPYCISSEQLEAIYGFLLTLPDLIRKI